MKKNIFYLIIFTASFNFCAEKADKKEKQPINIYNNIPIHVSAGSSSAAAAQNKNTLKNSITLINNLPSREQLKDAATTFGQLLLKNKFKIAIGGLIGAYAYIWYKLLHISYIIHEKRAWSQWKKHLALDELMEIPQPAIAKDLLLTIQKYYATTTNLSDFFTPLVTFINDIDNEKKYIQELQFIHGWITRLNLHKIFPQHHQLAADAKEKLHRLSFLKNVLLTWLGEYKITLNTNDIGLTKRAINALKSLQAQSKSTIS